MGEPREPATRWSDLPENLQTEVLAQLPWDCLCRYRGVSRDWNALFSSTKFITEQWAAAPPNKKPSLVLSDCGNSRRCMAYCFFTKTWKTISLPFLTQKYRLYAALFDRSAVGLFLVTIDDSEDQGRLPFDYIVCNPLTATSLKLPAINPDTAILSIGIMGGERYPEATYRVVAVAKSGNAHRIEIYDSSSKSWRTAVYLPQNLEVTEAELRPNWMVLCEDVLYCFTKELDTMGIIDYSIQNGTSNFISLPQLEGLSDNRLDRLLVCGSRVLLATFPSEEHDRIIIWELEKKERTFHRIATIENFRSNKNSRFNFVFEGIGDLVCIKHYDCLEVFVYNLKDKSLSRLPTCPIHNGIAPRTKTTTIFGFEPRPDMRAE